MIFQSKVDLWFYALIFGILLVLVIAGTPIVLAKSVPGLISIAFAALIAVGLPVWLLATTNYQVLDETLAIRSGPFAWNIPRKEIHSVAPSRSLLSSPALSLDRLDIRYGDKRSILVSPKNRASFVEALGFDA